MKKSNKASVEQIAQWKEKYGEVNEIEVEDKVCYLKPINRTVLSLATQQAQSDTFGFTETILSNCWLGGDEEIKTSDSLFLGVNAVISELVDIKKATLKKL